MAFDLLICYQKEVNETVPTNCSVKTNSTLFKLCLASLEDDIYNNYMIFYGQIFMICEFYNGTRPMISAEKMFQVSFSQCGTCKNRRVKTDVKTVCLNRVNWMSRVTCKNSCK